MEIVGLVRAVEVAEAEVEDAWGEVGAGVGGPEKGCAEGGEGLMGESDRSHGGRDSEQGICRDRSGGDQTI